MFSLQPKPNGTIYEGTVTAPICGPLCRKPPVAHAATHHQIGDFFTKIFDTSDFPARWHCGNWTDFHGWLYIGSDLSIWAAYFAIPLLLFRVMIKRKNVALNRVMSLFLAFTFLCGLTHLFDALIFWWPAYRLSALLKFTTAIVSIIAVYILNKIFPALLGLHSIKELKLEIAKRKKTEERLSESEFLLSEAERIARVGGWEYDLQTKKYKWSKAVYDILEMPYNSNVHQQQPLSYYHSSYRDVLKQAAIRAVKNGEKWDVEALVMTLNNKSLWVRYIGEPVFNHQKRVVKIRGTLTDIDQYKKHEAALSRALQATQEKSERLQKFSYILSHNIRNHTSNLSALDAMVDVDTVDEENKELLLKSRQVTQALTTTLDDLAEVIEAQDEDMVKEVISIGNAAAKAIKSFTLQINQTQAIISQSFVAPSVCFPALYLDSMMKHLLSNAIRYRDIKKSLHIELRSYLNDKNQVVLECQDNGIGMDLEAYGHKLFGLYATFHPSLSARGVGLFLIKTQVESQGGTIEVNSAPGEGTLFKVTFGNEI